MSTVTVVGEVVLDRIIQDSQQHDVLGGSAANTALALVRAGHHVDLRARFGSDAAGQFLKATAESLGIDVRNSIDAVERATVVEARIDSSGVPSFMFDLDNTSDWFWTSEELAKPLALDTVAITTGSPASIASPGFTALIDWVHRQKSAGTPFFYDPNIRPSVIAPLQLQTVARDRILEWVKLADVVKASDEDLNWLDPSADASQTAAHLSTLGPELVVLTQGGFGASAFHDGKQLCHVSTPAVEVADTVGAGDTVMAWLISGLSGQDRATWSEQSTIEPVLSRAVQAAAYTCTQVGADPIFRDDLDRFLANSTKTNGVEPHQ